MVYVGFVTCLLPTHLYVPRWKKKKKKAKCAFFFLKLHISNQVRGCSKWPFSAQVGGPTTQLDIV